MFQPKSLRAPSSNCWVGLAFLALIGIAASACVWSVDRGPRVTIVNDLDQPVTISRIRDGVEESMARNEGGDALAPGEERGFSIRATPNSTNSKLCDSVEFIARASDGQIVARLQPPVCMGDRRLLSGLDAASPDELPSG